MINQAFKNKLAARLEQNNSNGTLEVIGTLQDVLEFYGATSISAVRQKDKNPYITAYLPDGKATNFPFSTALYTQHQKNALSLGELLQSPVYWVTRPNAQKETIEYCVLGVTQGSTQRDDIHDLKKIIEEMAKVGSAASSLSKA